MTTMAQATEDVSYLEAISQALDEEMARDERVFVMGEDVVKRAHRSARPAKA